MKFGFIIRISSLWSERQIDTYEERVAALVEERLTVLELAAEGEVAGVVDGVVLRISGCSSVLLWTVAETAAHLKTGEPPTLGRVSAGDEGARDGDREEEEGEKGGEGELEHGVKCAAIQVSLYKVL